MLQAKSKEGGERGGGCRNEMTRIMEMLLEFLWSKMS